MTKFKPGDHALLMAEQAGFAEFAVMPESQCIKLPPSLPFEEAASMALVYDTAYFALKDRGRIAPGETVLVLGATGGVGLAAIQLAKAMGGKVFAAVASKDKEDIVRAAGADAIVDLSAPDLHESLRAQVFALTGKKGVDIIVDMLGGDIFDAAVRALAWCGRLIVIGFASGRIPSLKMNYVLVKNIEVSGMQISDYRKRRPADMQAAFADIIALHAAGKLKPLPTKAYPLEQFAEALSDIKDRKVRGRIVLTMRRNISQSRQARRASAGFVEVDAFQREQFLLGGGAAVGREAAGLVAGGQHAVAGDDDRHRVFPHRLADIAGALPAGQAELFRQLAVGHGVAEADAAQRRVEFLAEIVDAVEIDGDGGKIDRLAGQIALDVGDERLDPRRHVGRAGAVAFPGEAQLGLAAILFRQLHADEPARVPRDAAFADRGVEQMMMGGLRVHAPKFRSARPAMPPDLCADARYIIGQYGATP